MKIATLLLLTGVVLSGCHKDPGPATPAARRIAYISGFGELTWQGGRLETAAGAVLTYTGKRLTALRKETRDTTITVDGSDTIKRVTYSVTQYSFNWIGGNIQTAHLDTGSVYVVQSGAKLSDMIDAYTLNTGLPCTYFYTDERLDSMVYTESSRTGHLQKIVDQYDGAGNIVTQTVLDYGSLAEVVISGTVGPGQLPPPIIPTESICTFTYDDHPNPWHMLLGWVGVALPGMEGRNFSRNNPLTADIDLTVGVTTDAHKTVSWHYEYDARGYPVSISSSAGGEVTRIRYQ